VSAVRPPAIAKERTGLATPPGYPLAVLRELRTAAVDAAERALGEAVAARVEAEAARTRALVALEMHRERVRVAVAREAEAGSAVRAVLEAQRAADFARRLRAEVAALHGALQRCERGLVEADARVDAARQALAAARAEAEAVERHFAAWCDARRRAAEVRAETEADDLASARAASRTQGWPG
jgi:flagellar biosynthesis chaperone FliJ